MKYANTPFEKIYYNNLQLFFVPNRKQRSHG